MVYYWKNGSIVHLTLMSFACFIVQGISILQLILKGVMEEKIKDLQIKD